MTGLDEVFLPLSGLQHFAFCRRQWALIHIEAQWQDDLRTVDGQLFHHRAHDEQQRERRGELLILRGLAVTSAELGLTGKCDVVEFRSAPSGIALQGEDGLWRPFPVEYKRGAQALCLEEMLCCTAPQGVLFYGETRRRAVVDLTEALRAQVRAMAGEMHQLYQREYTPKVKPPKSCNACSLRELCLPALMRSRQVGAYLRQAMEDEP